MLDYPARGPAIWRRRSDDCCPLNVNRSSAICIKYNLLTLTRVKGASPQAIAERAYLIWENMGRPEGQALETWLRAEAELGAEAAPVAKAARWRGRGRRNRKER